MMKKKVLGSVMLGALLCSGMLVHAEQQRGIVSGVVIPFVQSLDQGVQLSQTQTTLAAVEAELATTQAELAAATTEIDAASLLLSGTSIPEAATINSLVAEFFSGTPHAGSNPPPPIVDQITNGLNPYLQATLALLYTATFTSNETGTVVQVAAGANHALVLLNNGHIYGVGDNTNGQLGNGSCSLYDQPVLKAMDTTPLDSAPSAIYAGGDCSFVLTAGGKIYGCGNNSLGQLGIGNAVSPQLTLTPMNLTALGVATPVEISTGGLHTLVRVPTGVTAYGCGNNDHGQLGQGDTMSPHTSLVSIVVGVGLAVNSLSAGLDFSLFMLNDSVYSCGNNTVGQLGDGTIIQRTSPVLNFNPVGSGVVVAGRDFGCAYLNLNDEAYCWGNNSSGQLGLGTVTPYEATPQSTGAFPLAGNAIAEMRCGDNFTIALDPSNLLYGCGNNTQGQLGLGNTTSPQSSFVAVDLTPLGVATVLDFAVGSTFTLAASSDNKVYGAGDNSEYQLGLGTTASPQTTLTPMKFATAKTITVNGLTWPY